MMGKHDLRLHVRCAFRIYTLPLGLLSLIAARVVQFRPFFGT